MASSLAAGAFITSIDGKRCTAVPKSGASTRASTTSTSSTTSDTTSSTSVDTDTQTKATTTNNADPFTAALATTTSSKDESSTSTSTTISTSLIATTSTFITSDVPPQQGQTSAQGAPAALEPTSAPEASPAATTSTSTSTTPTFAQITTSESQPQPAQTVLSSAIIQSSQTDTVDTALATQTTPDPTPETAPDTTPNTTPSTTPNITPSTTSHTTSENTAASVQQGTALPDVVSSSLPAHSTASSFTAGLGAATGSPKGAAAETSGPSSATNGNVSAISVPNNSNAIHSTVMVAGGVIGGILLISIVAFVGWWWRRRSAKRRRSTMLTPLTMDNASGPEEKEAYVINRGSIGPTPRSEKFKAALGFKMRKMKGSISRIVTRGHWKGSPAPSVNMNRGTSQFTEPGTAISDRSGSSAATVADSDEVTTKDRLIDWWTRLAAGFMSFNWRLKTAKNPDSDDLLGSPRGMNEKKAGGNPPDFLTLLGMDDRELDREAQRRRMSGSRLNAGSASSSGGFLGSLNLNFGGPDDPFADVSAIAAKPAPLVVSQRNNPFSDANAVPAAKPGTYVAEIRRSRGQSASSAAASRPWRPPSSSVGGYRESGASVASFATRRNKFRSDPFDLERPELLGRRPPAGSAPSSGGATVGSSSSSGGGGGGGSGVSAAGVAAGDDVRRPPGAHTRTDSYTSKYSSDISLADWSDPGPDVGPAAARSGGWQGPEQRESPTQGWRTRLEQESAARAAKRTSGGSEESVGKAL